MRNLGLASLLTIVLTPSVARADDEIVLQLPPSPQAAAAASENVPPPKPKPNPALSVPTKPNRRGPVNRFPTEKVIGRLGVAAKQVQIHRSRGSGRIIATVAAGTYLALTMESGNWYGVLMADRSTGWLAKSAVNVLDYEVVAPNTPDRHRYADYAPPSDLGAGGARSILSEAYKYLGVPYRYGGSSPNGLDCSAFVQHCFRALGIGLPRTATEQMACGMPVSPDQLQAADRLYFASRSGRISHTGIYIGDGYFIHASSSRGGVAISRLSEPLYQKMFAGARR